MCSTRRASDATQDSYGRAARTAGLILHPPTGTYNDCYLKDLPLDKALGDEVLLATELNGAPLSEDHGAPVRLVAPGYYGKPHQLWGWAWSADEVSTVELSTDAGASWTPAVLDKRQGYCWQRFAHDWMSPAPGEYELACRATDRAGISQPAHGARNQIFKIKVRIGIP